MQEPVKITRLDIEDFKRIKAVHITPTADGLTIIGGKNGQGKTSVLDGIMWALGGERYKPTDPVREGADTANISLELSNGLTVTRSGKNGSLKVRSKMGVGGQRLLDEFVSQLALDMPKFCAANDKAKADILLKTLGVGDRLASLDAEIAALFARRTECGRDRDRAVGYAESIAVPEDAPTVRPDVSALASELQYAMDEDRQRQRSNDDIKSGIARVERHRQRIGELAAMLEAEENAMDVAEASLAALRDKSATPRVTREAATIRDELAQADQLRTAFDTRAKKIEATDAARAEISRYTRMSEDIETLRTARIALLEGAKLPLSGLGIDNGALTYNGRKWDCMSGADQLRVSAAIVSAEKPQCGFVLMDKLEQFDTDTLAAFGEWARERGLQLLSTRVSTGPENTVIIEDGTVREA